jgi:riboflavin synthase
MPYIIEKGYVTIDGASLTITEIDDKTASFGIMLISHSQSILTLTNKEVSVFPISNPNLCL